MKHQLFVHPRHRHNAIMIAMVGIALGGSMAIVDVLRIHEQLLAAEAMPSVHVATNAATKGTLQMQSYKHNVARILASLDTHASDDALQRMQQALLGLTVPQALQAAHLQNVLGLEKLKSPTLAPQERAALIAALKT